MPDDFSGNHSLPLGYRATTGEIIEASQHNPPLEDLSASMSSRLSRDGRGGMRANLAMSGFKVTGSAAGTAPDDLMTVAQVTALLALQPTLPTGSIQMFAGSVLPLGGWLWCDGSAVSRTTYAALFAALGTVWGVGDGSTTFNLPDASGRFPRFLPRTGSLDPGRVLGTTQLDLLGSHSHAASSTVIDPGHVHLPGTGTGFQNSQGGSFLHDGLGGSQQTTVSGTTQSSLTGVSVATTIVAAGGAETRPVNIAFNAIIKT